MKKVMNFEKDSIWSLIIKNGIPAMITMIVVIIYNLADTFFVGQTHNDLMVAAVSVAAPIFTLLITVGTLIGSGGCSIISNALGSKDYKRAKQTSSFCFYGSIIIGILFAIVILVACEPILRLVGATDNTISMASIYLKIIAIGTPFIIFSNTMANIIRADGAAKESMVGNMIGTILNIVLDPIMILVFKWEIAGAAIATVIGNVCACIFYVIYMKRSNSKVLSYSTADFTLKHDISLPVFSIGLPGALSNLLMSFSNIVMNLFLVPYGDGAVAAMGVAMKIGMIVAMIQMGLCMGVLPILAYNFGSHKVNRVKETILKTGILCVILGSIMTCICYLCSNALVSSFVTDIEIIKIGTQMVIAIILSGPVLGLFFLTTNIMQAAGKSLCPTVTSLSRQGLIYIPCLILLNSLFGLNGIIYTQAVSDIVATIISITICIVILKKCFLNSEKITALNNGNE